MNNEWKKDFPLLMEYRHNGMSLAYLDNAATTQKPQQVLNAVRDHWERANANPHRGAYALSGEATAQYEAVREKAAGFINAGSPEEIVFTSGTTAAINLVALSYGMERLTAGDEILISIAEHHSNLLPWQAVAKKTGAVLRYLYSAADGPLSLDEVREKLSERTKIVAVTHVSNVLGNVNPIAEIAAAAHEVGAVVLVDAAQSAPHIPLDVQGMGIDFLAFSGHKMLGPAGTGVLYGRSELLRKMEPVMLGGGIVEVVREQSVRFLDAPWKFEAGTPNVEGIVGLGAAIDYLQGVGFDRIHTVEADLTAYALEKLKGISHVVTYGGKDPAARTGIISFNVRDVHPHDTASILDAHGVAIRAGHHCAQPLMDHLGVNAVCRMSLYFYNTREDIDRFVKALKTVREVLGCAAE